MTCVTYNVCISTDPQLSSVKILEIGHYGRGTSPTILNLIIRVEADSSDRVRYGKLYDFVYVRPIIIFMLAAKQTRTILLS